MRCEVKFSGGARLTWDAAFVNLFFMIKCDTCGKESAEVKRVIVDAGYDRVLAKPLYNCPACYEKKEESKKKRSSSK